MSVRDDENALHDRLEFFREALFEPLASDGLHIFSQVSACEVIRWTVLGSQLGYLDPLPAYRFLSTQKQIVELAWNFLKTSGQSANESLWGDLIRADEMGKPQIEKAPFVPAYRSDAPLARLMGLFQGLILFTSENLLTPECLYFQEGIGFYPSQFWDRFNGLEETGVNVNARSLTEGLSDFFTFLDEFREWWSLGDSVGVYAQLPTYELLKDINIEILRGEKFAEQNLIRYLFVSTRSILMPRFELGAPGVQDRFFEAAGSLFKHISDGGPAWVDAQRTSFNKMASALRPLIGQIDRQHLWRLYSASTVRDLNRSSQASNNRAIEGAQGAENEA